MRSSRRLVAALLATATLAIASGSASADCSGPTIEHDTGSVDRDETVRVIGSGWGDGCYDTGPPPEGESVLGNPVHGIEVFLVQGGVEHLVATGDADDGYEFQVDVAVPDDLAPGPVDVVARSPLDVGTFDATPDVLVVSDRAPTGEGDDAPVRFGPAKAEPAPSSTAVRPSVAEDQPDDQFAGTARGYQLVLGSIALVVGCTVLAIHLRRRSARPSEARRSGAVRSARR